MAKRIWRSGLAAVAALVFSAPILAADGAAVEEGEYPVDSMFEYLTAELAAQRGDNDSAFAIYMRLAREMHDPQIARRAVESAIRVRAMGPALDAATLLLELEPESNLAREVMAALLANDSDLQKARARLAEALERSGNRTAVLMQLSQLLSRFQDKAAVLAATRSVVQPYEALPEAHYAIGVAALLAGEVAAAAQEADAALERKGDWEPGAILKAQVLRKSAPSKVLPFYEEFVAAHPNAIEVRMQLGRELAGERKLKEAREQFHEVEKIAKNDPQSAYAIGLLSLQLEDWAEAQTAFTRALKLGYREPAAIYLGLGAAAEGMKRVDEAIGWYQKVESGDWVRAQLKIAQLMAKQNGLAAGREYLQKIEPRSDDDHIQILQVEAQLLRDAKEWHETFEMLTKAVDEYPDSFELRYDRAMAAERIDRLDVLESELRKVIKMKPDYAHAYNALGYTLAEKTDRLAEARELIEKALKLAPDDPFILDSLGWVQYRLGHVQEALKHLQVAYSSRPDPEIAAHLGEVLWKSGQRDEAQKVWRAALAENPNHESLLAVMQKYKP